MASTFYITAGLPAIDSADSLPTDDITRFYITAGLVAGDYVADLSINIYDSCSISESSTLAVSSPEVSTFDTCSVSESVTVNRRAAWYNADTITINYGVLDAGSGTKEATWQQLTDYYIVDEANTTPPFQVDFTFNDIPAIDTIALRIYGYYKGNPAHEVKLYVYNYNTTNWDAVTSDTKDLQSASSDQNYNFTIQALDHVQSGTLIVRIQHNSPYAANHYLYINWMYLVHADEINVNDTVTLAEDISCVTGSGVADVSDNISISDVASGAISDAPLVVSDTVQVSEDISCVVDSPSISVYDQVSISEDITVSESDLNSSAVDTVTVEEYVEVFVEVSGEVSVQDDISVVDIVTVSVSDLVINLYESTQISEQVSGLISIEVVIEDLVGISELVQVSIAASDTLSLSVFDSVSLSEYVIGIVSDPCISVSDNVSISEYANAYWVSVEGILFIDVDIIVPLIDCTLMIPEANVLVITDR